MPITLLRFPPNPEPEPDIEPVIPLRDAVLCVDCESVVRNTSKSCPSCGSRVLVLVQPFVDGAS